MKGLGVNEDMDNYENNSLLNPDMREKPYKNQLEYLNELMALVDLRLKIFLENMKRDIQVIDTLKIVNEKMESIHEYFKASNLIYEAESYIISRYKTSAENNQYFPIDYACDTFGLSDFGKHCFILSLLSYLDQRYERVFMELNENKEIKQPTLEIAACLFMPLNYEPNSVYMLIKSQIFELSELLVFKSLKRNDFSIRHKVIEIDKRILDFIFDPFGRDESILSYVEYMSSNDEFNDRYIEDSNLKKIETYVANSDFKSTPCLLLYGAEGCGKKITVKKYLKDKGMDVIFVNFSTILEDEQINLENELWYLVRECKLKQLAVCVQDIHLIAEHKRQKVVDKVIERLRNASSILFFTSNESVFQGRKIPDDIVEISFDTSTSLERKKIWEEFSSNFNIEEGIDFAALANKFKFTHGQIISTLKRANIEASLNGGKSISNDLIYKCCYKQIKNGLSDKASKVEPKYEWGDLVIPEEQKKMLKDACDYIKYRHIVYEEWDFDSRLSYGKGLSLLFSGLPGTGKTMAAQVVAKELNLELYKIDLSRIIDKYVGETEKNIRLIFEEAKKCNVVLFFDEADALFGKRSEVKDSHDRYANIETSFLLQCIEEYEGISILATNYKNNMDDAFKRRISFVIELPFPDAKVRKEIWEGIFPKKTPLDSSVDLDFIAKNFELVGGNIKNVAVAAAFLAASEGRSVEMKDILIAIKREYTKVGKILLKTDLGYYASLLSD